MADVEKPTKQAALIHRPTGTVVIEPPIQIFGRDGVQKTSLPVPPGSRWRRPAGDRDRRGAWRLIRPAAYRAAPGMRISEVTAYGRDSLVVMEASVAGNHVSLYAVPRSPTGPTSARSIRYGGVPDPCHRASARPRIYECLCRSGGPPATIAHPARGYHRARTGDATTG